MMSEYIDLLLNMNLLFFSISFAWAFSKIADPPFEFRKRIKAFENLFSKERSKKLKEIRTSILSFVILISFTVLLVVYFFMFNNFVSDKYDDRFWDVARLVCTPFIFLILPLFLSQMLVNFDKKSIKSHKFSFAFDWIWFLVLLTLLTLFVSWEVNIVWLAFLVLSLVLLLIVAKLLSIKRSKVV
jgi:hypothetical protein